MVLRPKFIWLSVIRQKHRPKQNPAEKTESGLSRDEAENGLASSDLTQKEFPEGGGAALQPQEKPRAEPEVLSCGFIYVTLI
jgi:hypothetical protein